MFKLVMQIRHTDQQKMLLESDFSVSSDLNISTLLTIDDGSFFPSEI